MQEADFQHVVNSGQHLGQIEWLADEVLRSGLQRAQLVIRLSSNHKDWKIAARLDFLKALHDLKSVPTRHLEIEKDQVVAVLLVQLSDLARIPRRCDGIVSSSAQHLLQQDDIGLLVVDNQDAGLKNVR